MKINIFYVFIYYIMSSKSKRKSPSDSATKFSIGTKKREMMVICG